MANSDLKKIVKELGNAVFISGERFDDWVVPRLSTLLRAIDELEALKAELAEKSWRVIGPNFENLPKTGDYCFVSINGVGHSAMAIMCKPPIRPGEPRWELEIGAWRPIEPGDAWMPWPTDGPKLLEVNND